MTPMYEYRARAVKVQDGDTVKLEIDLGLHVHKVAWVRLANIDAPELKEADGSRAKARLIELLKTGEGMEWPLIVNTIRDRTEKYGRWLATIRTVVSGIDVGQQMVEEGLARPYSGGRR